MPMSLANDAIQACANQPGQSKEEFEMSCRQYLDKVGAEALDYAELNEMLQIT